MDVSHVKNDIDSPLKWGLTYKSENTDDFARHLADNDRNVDAYEPKEKVQAEERLDDDNHIEDDDPAEDRVDHDHAETTVSVAVVQAPQISIDATNAAASTTPAASEQAAAAPVHDKTVSLAANTQDTADVAHPAKANEAIAANTDTKANPAGAVTQQAATLIAANGLTAAATKAQSPAPQKGAASDAASPVDAKASPTATTAKPETAELAKAQALNNPLEKFRVDEMAKMSEKDVLSSKISELIAKGNGKITTIASGSTTSGAAGQNSLVSANNSMVAATSTQDVASPTKTDTAIGMVTQTTQRAEAPILIPNGDLSASLLMPQATGDTNLSTTTVIPGGAINGIDSTSTNSISQANMAARASAQAGSPAEQVATQITTAAKEGVDLIKVQLNPAELGRIDIKLEMGHDGRILAVISADNQNSLDLLQQDSKQLEKALQDAGFDTGSDSLNFSLNQGSAEEGNGQDQGMTSANAASTMESDEDLITDPTLLSNSSSPNSGLDIQV